MSDDIKFMLGEISTSIRGIETNLVKMNGRLDHHSGRIGRLERWQATIAGAGAVAGVAVGSLLTSFRKFLD
jgi:hypothetical protein